MRCQLPTTGRSRLAVSGKCLHSVHFRHAAIYRRRLHVHAVNYDPDGLFKGVAPREGWIQRRQVQKEMLKNNEFAKAMQLAEDETRRQVIARRELRSPPNPSGPDAHAELVEYFLNTPAEDIEYEVARCRPALTPAFFQFLDKVLGQERFAAKPDEERLAELDALRQYLDASVKAVDTAVSKMSSAADRMKKLLMAKDKKAMILEMAGNNEIDPALIQLLQQNIDAARAAGQEGPAKFMEKVMQAASKYVVAAAPPAAVAPPPPPTLPSPAKPGQGPIAATSSSIIAPGGSSIITPGSSSTNSSNPSQPDSPPPKLIL